MTPNEKADLVALLGRHESWCQDAEARDGDGNPVRFDDSEAVAWDVTGAMCHLFGWKRACVLFEQLDRHIQKRPHPVVCDEPVSLRAMAALQDYNDRQDTTSSSVIQAIESMPVWRRAEAGGE